MSITLEDVRMLLKIPVTGKVVECDTIGRSEAVELVCSALDVPEKEAEQQINKDLKVNKAWLKSKWGLKPTSSLKGKEKKMVTPKV
ncbi:hypothetical protein Scep_026356 [Stephania cephalantha]|uniref:Uncharacterized protein n=1 Tax=Stephania cephalantha TaxID=152367 RepID=A0AAP0HRZ8_9MAGN